MSGSYTRASQVETEALGNSTSPYSRASQAETEALGQALSPFVRASQVDIEATGQAPLPFVRASQVIIEAFIPYLVSIVPSIYPSLTLGYNVVKRPIWNFGVGEGTSGAEVRVGYWESPLWEWDLTYEYLPDSGGGWAAGVTSSDIQTMVGFYNSVQGGFLPFCYLDPDDNQVLSQQIGIGNGSNTYFVLSRTYGNPAYGTSTENVGYVNTTGPVLNGHTQFNVYLNGVLQNPSSYTLVQTSPVSQYINFNTPPASGAVVTVDMSYYYWVRFLDPKYDFEKFMNKLWSTKKITLHSLRQ